MSALKVGDQAQRAEDYYNAVNQAFDIFKERNAKYGDSFVHGGLMGIAGEIVGVGRRLEKILLKDPPLFVEDGANDLMPFEDWESTVRNALIDALNYADMGLILMNYRLYHGVQSDKQDSANQ